MAQNQGFVCNLTISLPNVYANFEPSQQQQQQQQQRPLKLFENVLF